LLPLNFARLPEKWYQGHDKYFWRFWANFLRRNWRFS
jgi:hypothetical protein